MRVTNRQKFHRRGGSIFGKIFNVVKKIVPKIIGATRKALPYARKGVDFYRKNKDTINTVADTINKNVVPQRYRGKVGNIINKTGEVLDSEYVDKGLDAVQKVTGGRISYSGGFMISDKQAAGFNKIKRNSNVYLNHLEVDKPKKSKSKMTSQDRIRMLLGKK